MPPEVTVLMSVYNGEQYLHEAVESILNQTFDNFIFLILDDASTDSSIDIIRSFKDPRIKIIHNEDNLGLTLSLNKGLELSEGKYIARMDADDISLPRRLERQVQFLDSNPGIGICGTWVQNIGHTSESVWRYPVDSDGIKCTLLFESAFAHPSVMIRSQMLTSNNLSYSNQFFYAQDYDLWVRSARHTKLANLSEVLLLLRQHPGKIGESSCTDQQVSARKIRELQIKGMGISASENELSIHNHLAEGVLTCSRSFVEAAGEWLDKLRKSNQQASSYPEPAFSLSLAERWYKLCWNSSPLGLWTFKKYRKSPLFKYKKMIDHSDMQLFLRCLFRKGYWKNRPSSLKSE